MIHPAGLAVLVTRVRELTERVITGAGLETSWLLTTYANSKAK